MSDTQDTFDPPGPGSWLRLDDHLKGALTAEYQLIHPEASIPGMASYMERYGVLARTLDVAFVHGHIYAAPIPLVGSPGEGRPPSRRAIWLLSRVHPALRQRTKAARRSLADRSWRAATEHWYAVEREQWRARDQAMQDEDPAALDDAALTAHLGRCRQLVVDGYRRHFELHGDDLLPIGLLIARCEQWGIDAATSSAALAGASPVSTGAATPPDWQLVTGYDLDSLAACELSRPAGTTASPPAPQPLDLAPLVRPEDRAELAELLADARAAVPLRDDNGPLTGAWPAGLLRRAMLEAGRRIGLHRVDHAVELTVAELVARLGGASSPSADDAAERAAHRRYCSSLHAPTRLGPERAIPPLSALPRPLATIAAAQLAAADHMTTEHGGVVGIGEGPYTGRALVVDDPAVALGLMEPGDVVVTDTTTPTWNVILAHAGALVTTTGGVMSHAAVIARELGIPALIGEPSACRRLVTGMLVTVDPRAGTVLPVG